MTMARDEADMLPRWLRYYGRQVGTDNLIVIDDGTTDGSTDQLPCQVYRMPAPPWKASWMQTRVELVNGFSRGLLALYDVMIFTDVDEFLVPDPLKHDDLVAFIDARADREVLAPVAVNLVHHPGVEGPLDEGRPLLAQRRFVKWAPGMCKPLIKRVPAPWMQGFHGIRSPYEVDPELMLIHAKFYDREALYHVAERRHELLVKEGRGGPRSSWSVGPKEMQEQLTAWVGDENPDTLPEFSPDEVDLAGAVNQLKNGFFRAAGRQIEAMASNPLRVLPVRFRGAF